MTIEFLSVSLSIISVILSIASLMLPFGKRASKYAYSVLFADKPTHLNESKNAIYSTIVKRIFDIILSLVLIILTIPIMLIISLFIYAEDRGPLFFRQERLTKNNKRFYLRKFRSMYCNAEKLRPQSLSFDYDIRITKVGRIIRKLQLDELPVLFSIFKGDMSFIGMACIRPEEKEIIGRDCIDNSLWESYYEALKRSKPGYISYRDLLFKLLWNNDGKQFLTDWGDQVYYIVNYYNHESLKLDFAILISSISASISDRDMIEYMASELSSDKHSHLDEQQ